MSSHRMFGRQLSVDSEHRKAIRRNLVQSLFEHGKVRTTHPKAKEVKAMAEKLITLARTNTITARRRATAILNDRRLTDDVEIVDEAVVCAGVADEEQVHRLHHRQELVGAETGALGELLDEVAPAHAVCEVRGLQLQPALRDLEGDAARLDPAGRADGPVLPRRRDRRRRRR